MASTPSSVRSFLYRKDAEAAAGSANFATRIAATPVPLGLSAALATAYGVVDEAWQSAYAAAVNPATRGKSTVTGKNVARRAMRRMAADLIAIINATPGVDDQQKVDLGIAPRAVPSAIPAPTAIPLAEIEAVRANVVSLKVRNPANGKRGLPAGCVGIRVYSFTGLTPPNDINAWVLEGSLSRTSKIDIEFPISLEPFTRVWFTCAYFTARQLTGPGCTPFATNLGSFVVEDVEGTGQPASQGTPAATTATLKAA